MNSHATASILAVDDGDLLLEVRPPEGVIGDLDGLSVEITPRALASLVEAANAGRAAIRELREHVDQLEAMAVQTEANATEAATLRRRRQLVDRAIGLRLALSVARTRLERVIA